MKIQLIKSMVLLALIASTMMSCNKEQDIQPTSQAVPGASNVQVINGRLVFADDKSFTQVRTDLAKMFSNTSNTQGLENWEKSISFKSLRSIVADDEILAASLNIL